MGGFALLLLFGLSACGVGVRQTSAASDEDTGSIHAAPPAPQAQAETYTTQAGDTLTQIAARPEVYADPDLWPLLLDANGESLKGKSADDELAADLVLEVPRGSTPEVMDSARERARSFSAELKARAAVKAHGAEPEAAGTGASAGSSTPAAAPSPPAPTARPTALAAAPTAEPTEAPATPPASAPTHGSRMLPLFLLLLLVLAALAAVFYVFSRRDKHDFE
jgi:cell division septation protein DedD